MSDLLGVYLTLFLIIWWAAGIGFTAWLAGEKGRSPGLWLLLAVFLNPVALIALIGAPRKEAEVKRG